MSGIFISYRREDATAYARLMSEALAEAFGKDNIFRDVDTLTPGADFPVAIANAVGKCDVLLALIGSKWLTTKRQGKRRLDDPNDYVRLEIAAALDRETLVVPVLLEGAKMPLRAELPEPLAELANRNAHRLTDEGWSDGIRRLVDALETVVAPGPPLHSGPPSGQQYPAARAQSSEPAYQPLTDGPPESGLGWTPRPPGSGEPPMGQGPTGSSGHPPSSREGEGRGKLAAVIVGAVIAAIAVVVVVMALGSDDDPDTIDPSVFLAETNLVLSPTTGGPGTVVTVNGSGFLPNEGIELRFHTTVVTQTRADADGEFSGVMFSVPGCLLRQCSVVASGKQSFKSARAPFQIE